MISGSLYFLLLKDTVWLLRLWSLKVFRSLLSIFGLETRVLERLSELEGLCLLDLSFVFLKSPSLSGQKECRLTIAGLAFQDRYAPLNWQVECSLFGNIRERSSFPEHVILLGLSLSTSSGLWTEGKCCFWR